MKIISLFNKIVRHTSWYNYEYWNGITKFWKLRQFGLDIVNLGSDIGVYDFDYSECNLKASNWALSPQSLVHDYNILRNYFSYLRQGAVVIITISPFSCLFSIYGKEHNFKYYTILHPATVIDFDDNERTKALLFQNNPFKQAPILCIRKTIIEVLRKIMGLVKKGKINIQRTADEMISVWKQQYEIKDFSEPMSAKHIEQFESRKETLRTIIEFCKERDLKPIIVIPPMHHTLWKQFPENFIHNYLECFVNEIDVPVYDYMKSQDFDKDEYYLSALLLNSKGARIFTARVIEDCNLLK